MNIFFISNIPILYHTRLCLSLSSSFYAISLAFVSIVVGYRSIIAIAHEHHCSSTIGALPQLPWIGLERRSFSPMASGVVGLKTKPANIS
ncbi:hypothetical protein ACSBR2_039922 [Camellia fascicularis]